MRRGLGWGIVAQEPIAEEHTDDDSCLCPGVNWSRCTRNLPRWAARPGTRPALPGLALHPAVPVHRVARSHVRPGGRDCLGVRRAGHSTPHSGLEEA